MKTILVEIIGITPLLMNSPAKLLSRSVSGSLVSRKNSASYEPLTEATNSAYRTKNGELYLPSECVFSMILEASKAFRIKNQNLSKNLAGSIRIEPNQILLGTKEFEIDAKRVVVQKASVIRHRAKLSKWKASFEIVYDEVWLPGGPEILKEVIESAGVRVGLLDYRPSKKGPYGAFRLNKWEVKK